MRTKLSAHDRQCRDDKKVAAKIVQARGALARLASLPCIDVHDRRVVDLMVLELRPMLEKYGGTP